MKTPESTTRRGRRRAADRRAASADSPARPSFPPWTAPALLFAAAVAVYLPALNGTWLWDDKYAVHGNLLLRHWSGLLSFWTSFGNMPAEEHYWPVTYSVLWLEWRCWGESVAGFHFANFALHGLIVVQLFRLCRRIGMGAAGAAIATALFALHPVHAEAVAWIISVKDLLAALFYLAAIECCLNFHDGGRRLWPALGCLAAAAAMLSKSSPLMLPAGWGLLAWYRFGRLTRRDWACVALLGVVTISIASLDTWLRIEFDAVGGQGPSLAARLDQSAHAFWFYLQKLLLPVGLSAVYPRWAIDPGRALDWLPMAAIVLVTGGLWAARGRIGRGPLACWLFYGMTLGPALGVVYFGFLTRTPAADRYQYLASIGPIAGVGALAGAWIENHPARRGRAVAAVAAVLAFCGALTLRQAGYYRDEETLFSQARRVAPDSSFVYFNLGNAFFEQNRLAEAEKMFAEAVRVEPDYWMAVCNLGAALIAQNKFAEAVDLFNKAIDDGCTAPAVFCNAISIMSTSRDPRIYNPGRALRIANQLIERRGRGDPSYVCVLAMAQAANGRFSEAIDNARQALDLARQCDQPEIVQKMPLLIRLYQRGETERN
ncbi:MAG: tetratricopeptide repeat protein [Candidatus Sumerlaeia bacterium]